MFVSHFVAWDGKIIWYRPDYVKVNTTSDRATVEGSNDVFKKLYHKKRFLSWQITNVFQLLRLKKWSTPLLPLLLGTRGVSGIVR